MGPAPLPSPAALAVGDDLADRLDVGLADLGFHVLQVPGKARHGCRLLARTVTLDATACSGFGYSAPVSSAMARAETGRSDNFVVTRVDDVLNWARKNSAWYLLFGTACCAIELMQTGGPRSDIERFGMAPRASPRQADLIIVAGTVTYKMATRIKTLYDQMPEPEVRASRWAAARTAAGCSSSRTACSRASTRSSRSTSTCPGCPPRPEALIDGPAQDSGSACRRSAAGCAACGRAAGPPSTAEPTDIARRPAARITLAQPACAELHSAQKEPSDVDRRRRDQAARDHHHPPRAGSAESARSSR